MIKLWKKERWLLVPCPDYDVAAMEAWLEQQAQKGLFLSAENGFFLGFACFEVGNPKRVRYRLDAIPKEKVFADFPENKASAIELAHEMGWEYVTERREFLIYRCDDETLPELNTDPAVQALSLRRVQSTLSNRVFMSFYYLFIYPVLLLSFRLPALLLSVITLGTLRLLALLLIALVQTLGAVCDWRRLRKLRNHLQAGGRIEHTQENPGWTKRSVAEKIANPILTALWIVLLLSFVVKTENPARSTQTDLSASPLPAASSFLTLPQEDADERDELTLLARRDISDTEPNMRSYSGRLSIKILSVCSVRKSRTVRSMRSGSLYISAGAGVDSMRCCICFQMFSKMCKSRTKYVQRLPCPAVRTITPIPSGIFIDLKIFFILSRSFLSSILRDIPHCPA